MAGQERIGGGGPGPAMPVEMRPLRDAADYWAARELLRRAMVSNGLRERSWHVARLDYWWWFANPDLEHLDPARHVFLWETSGAGLVAMVSPEGPGEAHLQVDPHHRTPELEAAMLDTAEAHLAVARDGTSRLRVYVDGGDERMARRLEARGYRAVADGGQSETQHRRDLARPLPAVPQVAGYEVRPMRDGLELLERCYASGLAFHGDDIAVARENRDNPAWYHHIQAAPLYRRDLDIVAVAGDGSVAAFCTAWFDDVSRTAYLEPVATVARHRRRGLARAVILEALHRLAGMGCLVAFVGGYSAEANALYGSVMGPDHDVSRPWDLVR